MIRGSGHFGFALFIAAVWTTSGSVAVAAKAPFRTLPIGAPAPAFSLPGVDGKTYRLEDFADARVLVIVFTCNHCPTAQAYEERIKKLVGDYRDRGVALVAISPNDPQALRLDELGYTDVSDSFEEMKIRAKDRGFNFPYLYDGETQAVARAYGAVATPHVFIFDARRRLRYTGRIDDDAKPERVTSHDARNAVDALLAGRPVPVERTRMFGCSIKWSEKRPAVRAALEKWNREPVALEPIDKQGVAELVQNKSNRVRLINIWATWCGPCVAELPELVAIHRSYRRRPFELITISADLPERKEQVLKILTDEHVSSKNYIYGSDDVYELIEVVDKQWSGALPYTLLIAPGGKVLYRQQDEIDPLAVRRAIVDYLGRVY
ncbi:MAG TPA: redoxin domain-containing protein [Planctomycetaceae bacterium]|nr:redoxin domain-containing protein [Planctomycetaceae bacterium]